MAFAYLTFAQAAAILAERLGDPGQVYFNQPNELNNAIVEAVRFFQSLTGSYKQSLAFQTAQDVNYYSLASIAGSPVAYTVTDVEVINNVLAALLEPPLTPAWTGTGQFTFNQLQQSLQNRLNRFIGESGRQISQQIVAASGELTTLPDAVLDVRRAGWTPQPPAPGSTPPANPTYPLGFMDEWGAQAYLPDGSPDPIPASYSVYGTGPLQLRLIPPPLSAGNIDCVFVVAGPVVNLNPGSPVVLQIPDDLTAGLKWGVLADVLGTDGPSRDYARAAYCEARYQEYVQAARIYPSVLIATINNVTCGIGSIFDLDSYLPDWQLTTGAPSFVGLIGRHLACVGQTPDGVYGVGAIVCANAPVTGFMQVSRDALDPLIDLAQHIASFKMGGAEFDGTTRLYQNFIAFAKSQNARLEAIAFYKDQLEQPATKSDLLVPRMVAMR